MSLKADGIVTLMSEAELRKKGTFRLKRCGAPAADRKRRTSAHDVATKVTGQKDPMCAHFLGTRGKIACQHVLASVIASAKRWRQADKQIDTASSSAGSKRDVPPSSTNSSASQLNDKKVRQTSLVLFKGLSFPFTEEQKAAIAKQTLRATISAGLPLHWVHDPEVRKFSEMHRTNSDELSSCRLEWSSFESRTAHSGRRQVD